jgi:predicted kinase
MRNRYALRFTFYASLMEAIIFTGIQASGKSTFYKERFFTTHVRINLDMLRTRNRESILLRACLEMKQALVVDNTNVTAADRARYIALAKEAGFRVVGYYFQSSLGDSIRRNNERALKAKVPAGAIAGMLKRLEPPTLAEGFDELYWVRIGSDGGFVVEGPTDPAILPGG